MKIKNGVLTSVFKEDIPSNGIFIVPGEVRIIGFKAFYNNTKLKGIMMYGRVREIDDWAFGECSNLRKIEIPEGVNGIGEYAFCGCLSLESIYIPTSVKKIGKYAFFSCGMLGVAYVSAKTELIGDVFGSTTRIVWRLDSPQSAIESQEWKKIEPPSYLPKPIPPRSQLESNAGLFLPLSPVKSLWDKLAALFKKGDDGSLPLPNRRVWTTEQYYEQVNFWFDNHIATKRK